jgi:predicted phage tail protein
VKRKICLYGHLKKEFGGIHYFDVATPGEAIRALNVNFPTVFLEALRIGSYRIVRGRKIGGHIVELDNVNTFNIGNAELHIIPVATGAKAGGKGGGALKLVLGVALIGAAVFFSGGTLAAPLAGMGSAIPGLGGITWGAVGMMGLALTLSGASTMLTPKTKTSNAASGESVNYAFSGPVNSGAQGTALPLVYGEVITGSVTISTALEVEQRAS